MSNTPKPCTITQSTHPVDDSSVSNSPYKQQYSPSHILSDSDEVFYKRRSPHTPPEPAPSENSDSDTDFTLSTSHSLPEQYTSKKTPKIRRRSTCVHIYNDYAKPTPATEAVLNRPVHEIPLPHECNSETSGGTYQLLTNLNTSTTETAEGEPIAKKRPAPRTSEGSCRPANDPRDCIRSLSQSSSTQSDGIKTCTQHDCGMNTWGPKHMHVLNEEDYRETAPHLAFAHDFPSDTSCRDKPDVKRRSLCVRIFNEYPQRTPQPPAPKPLSVKIDLNIGNSQSKYRLSSSRSSSSASSSSSDEIESRKQQRSARRPPQTPPEPEPTSPSVTSNVTDSITDSYDCDNAQLDHVHKMDDDPKSAIPEVSLTDGLLSLRPVPSSISMRESKKEPEDFNLLTPPLPPPYPTSDIPKLHVFRLDLNENSRLDSYLPPPNYVSGLPKKE